MIGPIVNPDIKVNAKSKIGANVGLFLTKPIPNINANSIIISIRNNPDGTYFDKYTPNTATIKDNVNIVKTLVKKLVCTMNLILS